MMRNTSFLSILCFLSISLSFNDANALTSKRHEKKLKKNKVAILTERRLNRPIKKAVRTKALKESYKFTVGEYDDNYWVSDYEYDDGDCRVAGWNDSEGRYHYEMFCRNV